MKRDMELVRLLLLREEGDETVEAEIMRFSGEEQAYNGALLIDAGLVIGDTVKDARGKIRYTSVIRLTWAGHDFLDAVRDNGIWRKAKEKVFRPGASFTFDILKEWAKHEIKQQLGIP